MLSERALRRGGEWEKVLIERGKSQNRSTPIPALIQSAILNTTIFMALDRNLIPCVLSSLFLPTKQGKLPHPHPTLLILPFFLSILPSFDIPIVPNTTEEKQREY